MAFKTFTNGSVLTASDVNDYLMKQAVIVCTSGTRPASPVDGMTIYETDTDLYQVYEGSGWSYLSGTSPLRVRGRFTNTPTSSSGGEQAIYRTDSFTMKANRAYKISTIGIQLEINGSSNHDFNVRWRHTDNGTIPSTSSPEIGSYRGRVFNSGANNGVCFSFDVAFITGSSDITFQGLITMQRTTGTNTLTWSPTTGGTNIYIYEIGPAITATGITF